MRTAIICGALALAVTAARAAEPDYKDTANFMLPHCKIRTADTNRDVNFYWTGRCVGIVEGLVFGLNDSHPAPSAFCVVTPNGITNTQAVRVVVHYIEARPHRMREAFVLLATEALHET